MNNIFQKNISALALKNKNLAESLLAHIPDDIPQLVQENGAYNLLYKGNLIHNSQNPLGQAKEIFSMAKNEPVSIHLVYGLGLGYLFQLTSLNSKGTVILYEPDLNILRIVLTLVDFSNEFLKQNVYISDKLDEISEYIYQKSGMKNTPEMLSLPSQRESNPEAFNELVQKLQNLIGAFGLDLKYTKEKFYPSLKMLLYNIPKILEEKPLASYKDSLKGKTAVVVSAGPSLDRDIEVLKKYRDKYVLFTVGTAVKTLYKHGLKPDFLCIIETFNSSGQVKDLDLEDVNFITEPYSHFATRNFKYKRRFSHISANSPINHLWAELANIPIDEYWSKGTVSYTALNSARLLGCSRIISVGQDLAYIEGQCYSKDSAYKDLVCGENPDTGRWEIVAKDFDTFAKNLCTSPDEKTREVFAKRRLQNLNNSLHLVKGISGKMLPTESVYATFVKVLSEYTENFNDVEYINASLVGAQIDGFKNMPLEEALQGLEAIGGIELNTEFNYDKSTIKQVLGFKFDELKSILPQISEGKKYIKSIKNDLSRYKSVNEDILKTLKKISVNYLYLSSDFSNKSKLFDFMMVAEKIDLDYQMKMTTQFTYDSVTAFIDLLSKYYNNVELRIAEIEKIINKTIEVI